MLTNDDFKSIDGSDNGFDLNNHFEELTLNAASSMNTNSLAPPVPPPRRGSASATPTDSPLISPRHSHHSNKATSSTKNTFLLNKNIDFNLDLDNRISEQSSTFVKKPINHHQNESVFINNLIKDNLNEFQSGASRRNPNSQNNPMSGSNYLNNSLNDLLGDDLDVANENERLNLLKTSKSSLVFSNLNRKDDFNSQDNFMSKKPSFKQNFHSNNKNDDDEDCLLFDVQAHELKEHFQDAFNASSSGSFKN